ncbi:hypothetical protein H6503_03865 [Candidatus Woesearchaeota archaeon]|nr:hypothetical protein [Candidatus Woesearchaeota archaeon]
MNERVEDLGELTLKLSKDGFIVEKKGVKFEYRAPKAFSVGQFIVNYDDPLAFFDGNSTLTVSGEVNVQIQTRYEPKTDTLQVVRVGKRMEIDPTDIYQGGWEYKDTTPRYLDKHIPEKKELEYPFHQMNDFSLVEIGIGSLLDLFSGTNKMSLAQEAAKKAVDDLRLQEAYQRFLDYRTESMRPKIKTTAAERTLLAYLRRS